MKAYILSLTSEGKYICSMQTENFKINKSANSLMIKRQFSGADSFKQINVLTHEKTTQNTICGPSWAGNVPARLG